MEVKRSGEQREKQEKRKREDNEKEKKIRREENGREGKKERGEEKGKMRERKRSLARIVYGVFVEFGSSIKLSS